VVVVVVGVGGLLGRSWMIYSVILDWDSSITEVLMRVGVVVTRPSQITDLMKGRNGRYISSM
jgi:hypothetical protein